MTNKQELNTKLSFDTQIIKTVLTGRGVQNRKNDEWVAAWSGEVFLPLLRDHQQLLLTSAASHP